MQRCECGKTGKSLCFLLVDCLSSSTTSQLTALSLCLLFFLLVCAAVFEQPWSCAFIPHPGGSQVTAGHTACSAVVWICGACVCPRAKKYPEALHAHPTLSSEGEAQGRPRCDFLWLD